MSALKLSVLTANTGLKTLDVAVSGKTDCTNGGHGTNDPKILDMDVMLKLTVLTADTRLTVGDLTADLSGCYLQN